MEFQTFGQPEELLLMRQTCRDFVDDVIHPFLRGNPEREWLFDPDKRFPLELLEAADKVGLRTIGVPEKFGGVMLDPEHEAQTLAIISEEMGRGDSGFADKLAQNWKISRLLRLTVPDHLQEKWFPRLVEDPSFLLAHALTEPRGASDRWLPYNAPSANMDTRAVLENGQWVLNGRKHFISNGFDAKLFVVYANTNPEVGILDGSSSFLVPRDTPGLTVARCNETMGGRYMNNGEIVFDDCMLPEDHLLIRDTALQKKTDTYSNPGRIIQAAKNLGVGVAAFDDTAAYVQEYVQGGRPLIQHQAVAVRLADMAIKLESVRCFLRQTAQALDAGVAEAGQMITMLKVHASEEVLKVCQQAMELHGGAGTMLEMGIEKHFRDAAMFPHMDGTVDISSFKIIKSMFPCTAGTYAGPETDLKS